MLFKTIGSILLDFAVISVVSLVKGMSKEDPNWDKSEKAGKVEERLFQKHYETVRDRADPSSYKVLNTSIRSWK